MGFKRYKIVFSSVSEKKIKKIYEYISEELEEKQIALKMMNKIYWKIKNLEYMPDIYQKIELKDRHRENYRKIVVCHYIIIYTIDKENVLISNIFHEKNNYLGNI